MSFFNRQSLQERSVGAALMSDLGPGMHPRISIRGGQFALVDAGGNRYGAPCILRNTSQGQKMFMLAIIVGANPAKSRIFFEEKYDPDNPGPPDCFSDNGVAPSMGAASPQARTCAECHFGKWGSDQSQLTGKKTKACSEKKKIGVIIVGDTAGLTYELQIPPATLKNLAKYGGQVASYTCPGTTRRANPSDFITAVSFAPGQTGILEFEPLGWADCAFIDPNGTVQVGYDASNQPVSAADGGQSIGDRIDEIWESNELDEILGLKDTPWQPPAGFIGGGMTGGQPTGYLEQQPHGGALQRGQGQPAGPQGGPMPLPRTDPYVPPPGTPVNEPVRAFQPQAQPTQSTTAPPASPPAPPAGRRRRSAGAQGQLPAQGTVQPPAAQPVANGQAEDAIPPFLRRSAAANQPATGTNQANFGMANPPAPTGGIEAALNTAFNLPTAGKS